MPKSTRNLSRAQKTSATELRNFRTFLLMQQFAAREIGQRIAEARRLAGGMTQPDLAEVLDLSVRQIQNIEAGESIPWKHFVRLEQVFKRPLEWFLHGEEPDGDHPDFQVLVEQLEGLAADLKGAVTEARETAALLVRASGAQAADG